MQKVTLNDNEVKQIGYTEDYEEFINSILKAFNLDERLRDKMVIKTDDGTLIENADDFDSNIIGDFPPILVTVDIPKNPNKNEEEKNIKKDKKKDDKKDDKKDENEEQKVNQNSQIFDTTKLLNDIEKMLNEKILVNLNQSLNQVTEENKNLDKQLKDS